MQMWIPLSMRLGNPLRIHILMVGILKFEYNIAVLSFRRHGLHPGRSCGADRADNFRDRGIDREALGMGQRTCNGSRTGIDS